MPLGEPEPNQPEPSHTPKKRTPLPKRAIPVRDQVAYLGEKIDQQKKGSTDVAAKVVDLAAKVADLADKADQQKKESADLAEKINQLIRVFEDARSSQDAPRKEQGATSPEKSLLETTSFTKWLPQQLDQRFAQLDQRLTQITSLQSALCNNTLTNSTSDSTYRMQSTQALNEVQCLVASIYFFICPQSLPGHTAIDSSGSTGVASQSSNGMPSNQP